jgi:hypothetical protein
MSKIVSASFTCDDSRIIAASSQYVAVFDTNRGTCVAPIEVNNNLALWVHPMHPWLCAVAGSDGKVSMIDVFCGRIIEECEHMCELSVSAVI